MMVGDKNSNLQADIHIKDWRMVDLILSKGDIGLGKSYIEGLFTTDNIEDLLLLLCLNQQEIDEIFHSNHLYSLIFNIKNLFRKNSLKGSKKNIEYHYDLGNEFYQLWLDESMSYSSGIFVKDDTLHQSQHNKYQRIIDQLSSKGSNTLEIGCGWGGFIQQANKIGIEVTGLTLSNEQKAYSDQLIKEQNLKAKTALRDYRMEKGKYDNIVSIEMFEAVGKKYWSTYFAKVQECLKKDGKAVIQTIAINDEFYKKYISTSDYIREYIFPGGLLPSPNIFKKLAMQNKLHITDKFTFASSYHKTLHKWIENFNAVQDKILQLGYSQEFIRKWQFYLAYCAAGFGTNRTDVIQYTLTHSS